MNGGEQKKKKGKGLNYRFIVNNEAVMKQILVYFVPLKVESVEIC